MTVLPEGTVLGQLEIIEVFEYFDGPCLFSCRNRSGAQFLAVFADEGEVDIWLYAPVSEGRLEAVRAGNVDLHTAFADAEDGFTYLVKFNGSSVETNPVRGSSIPSDYLPDNGTVLRLPLTADSRA